MMLTGCLLAENTAGPPGDLAGVMSSCGWVHLWTGYANAWLWPEGSVFILHWIESSRKGHGTILMRGINQWAMMRKMREGSCTCEPELVPFYERFGWTRGSDFNEFATMWWRGKL